MKWHGEYFYGNKITDHEKQEGYISYATLAGAFDAVLNNDIFAAGWELGDWELISGSDCTEEDENGDYEYIDIYQFFIVDGRGVDRLTEAGEIVYYHEKLNVYLWGVTHYGTSWRYVNTSIKLELK